MKFRIFFEKRDKNISMLNTGAIKLKAKHDIFPILSLNAFHEKNHNSPLAKISSINSNSTLSNIWTLTGEFIPNTYTAVLSSLLTQFTLAWIYG